METKRTLTPEQIENLLEFCEFHDVFYYDVQIELVDHLATFIEEKWTQNPELTFQEALAEIYKTFGTGGFSKIRETKEKELRKKYTRIQWKYIGEFYTLPKVIMTLAITSIFYFVFHAVKNWNIMAHLIFLAYLGILSLYRYVLYPSKYKFELIAGKRFLLYDHYRLNRDLWLGLTVSAIFFFINMSNSFTISYPFLVNKVYPELISAFLITFLCINMVVVLLVIPQRIKEDFTNEFPQFVMA